MRGVFFLFLFPPSHLRPILLSLPSAPSPAVVVGLVCDGWVFAPPMFVYLFICFVGCVFRWFTGDWRGRRSWRDGWVGGLVMVSILFLPISCCHGCPLD